VFAFDGNYIFSTGKLLDLLMTDAQDPASSHDFGKDILPKLAGTAPINDDHLQSNHMRAKPTTPSPTGATWGPSTPTAKPTWTCAP
jgi:glucose-1-phosphate adenylyltransferase